jgi:hypothetical protein
MNKEVGAHSSMPQSEQPADALGRQVEIRCSFAELAQREADAAAARVAETRRLWEEQTAALAAAHAEVDPGITQAAKEKAHKAFRSAVAAARTRGQVESAAIAWLAEINKINRHSRAAFARIESAHAGASALQSRLARLSDSAESTARMAVAAMEACRSARAALAAPAVPITAPMTSPPARIDGAWTPEAALLAEAAAARKAAEESAAVTAAPQSEEVTVAAAAPAESLPGESGQAPVLSSAWLVIDLGAPKPQAIIRLIRRDGGAMSALVDRLAGNDPPARSRWQLNLSSFVDSIVALAIDEACFEFEPGNAFWDQFSAAESREIARGLAALGFRYDGIGGFVDGRVPTNRDLALAAGQAGLLPVKIRRWPSAEEAALLLRGVHVSADTFIAARAPALTLGELVRMLGRRAEYLADLWNDWPACRPLLLSADI